MPETQSAIRANTSGELVVVHDALLPAVESDRLLIKTEAVAINLVDVKLVGPMASPGATAGTDCAGVVVAIGDEVPPGQFAIGDRICAPVTPMNPLAPQDGAFADYVAVTADFALKIPPEMPFESAAALGIAVATAGYALFESLKLPGHPEKPAEKPAYVFVYGGSTASGTMAIQLLRRSGFLPITTCSPKNFALVHSYGAEKVFDYHDAECTTAIREYTKNALDYALDCYCQASSMKFCYDVIGRAGGRYTTLEPYPEHLHTRRRVKAEWILSLALLGKSIAWKEPYAVGENPHLRKFGKEWFRTAQSMLDKGEVRPHPVQVGEASGLEAVLEGVKVLSERAVSGTKLVYRIS